MTNKKQTRRANGAAHKRQKKNKGSTGMTWKMDMRCRFPRCKRRSNGPRYRFMCDRHMDTPKARQRQLVKQYREQQRAA